MRPILRAAALLCLCVGAPEAGRVAGGVVSSDEWRVTRQPQRKEEFIGNVRYRTGASVLRCDWALFEHQPQLWRLRGRVAVTHTLESGDLIDFLGDTGFMDQRSKKGWLKAEDLVAFKRTPLEGQPDHGRSKQADWEGRDVVVLSGSVHVWGPRLEAWSDRARYTEAAQRLWLTGGRPVVRKFPGWDAKDDFSGALKADEVVALRAQKQLHADGAVRGWIELKRRPE